VAKKDLYIWVEKRQRKGKNSKYYIRIEDDHGKRTTHNVSFDDKEEAKKEAEKLKFEILKSLVRRNEMNSSAMFSDEIKDKLKHWEEKEGNLIMIFHEIQNHFGYVPRNVAMEISEMLNVPLARIYEVLTFYNYFKLEEPGKYIISVCMGTACYLKGAPAIVDAFKQILDVEEGKTTKDGLFQLELVRCIGCCGLAPALSVNGEVFCNVKKNDVPDIINKFKSLEA